MTPKNTNFSFTLYFAIRDIKRNPPMLLNISMLVNIKYNLIAHWMKNNIPIAIAMVFFMVHFYCNRVELIISNDDLGIHFHFKFIEEIQTHVYAVAHGFHEMLLQQVDTCSNNGGKGLEFVSWQEMSLTLN
ncbi:hypothetical protein A6R68_16044, partial [Neotoma lepida]